MNIAHVPAAIRSTMGPPPSLKKMRKKQQQQLLSSPSPLAPRLASFSLWKSVSQDPFLGVPAQEAALSLAVCRGPNPLRDSHDEGLGVGQVLSSVLRWKLPLIFQVPCSSSDDHSCPGCIWGNEMNDSVPGGSVGAFRVCSVRKVKTFCKD